LVQGFTSPTPTSTRFTALAVNVPQHLAYLQACILAHSSAIITKADLPLTSGLTSTIKAALEIASTTSRSYETIVNALGLSARNLFASYDTAEAARLHPIRGQTVLVRGELTEIRTFQSFDISSTKTRISYAIPRPRSGTTVLGGCNIVDEWSTEVHEEMTAEILKNARALVPELLASNGPGNEPVFDVIKAQVGLRPGRRGGARVEPEVVSLDTNEQVLVVHSYGFAGAGFQNSVGVANQVLMLIESGRRKRTSPGRKDRSEVGRSVDP
jgi:D-amino-acid oxidase